MVMASMTTVKAIIVTFFQSGNNWIILIFGCLCILLIGMIIRKLYLILMANHLKKQLFQKIIEEYENESD